MDDKLPDPVIENPEAPKVGDPEQPALAPPPPQPEIGEPPSAPTEIPPPGIKQPEIPQRTNPLSPN
jgi:hypothetical protein